METIYFICQNTKGFNVSSAKNETTLRFSSSEPEVLFSGIFSTPNPNYSGLFDIHPDGDRLLMQQYLSGTANKRK